MLQANDAVSTGRVMKALVQLCFDTQEWDMLNEHILILTKRRNQLKTVSATWHVAPLFYPLLPLFFKVQLAPTYTMA